MSTGYDYISNTISVKFARAEQPEFREFKGSSKYVEFGKNNDYPEYLIGLFNESSKHGAIVRGKVHYIVGEGFENLPVSGIDWNGLLKDSANAGELFGGYYLQITWNALGQVASAYAIPYSKVRVAKDKAAYFVKNDWKDIKEKPRTYKAFSLNDKTGTCILQVCDYNPATEVYSRPPYFQALNYIESDVQVSRHILGNAKDGFVAGTLINLNNGDPVSEENKGEVERALKKKFTGSEGDRLAIIFNKSKENSAEIIPLGQTQLTKEDFTNVNELIQSEIFAGHQITSPALFGIKTPGQLGGRTEIRDAYEIFNNTYVRSRQANLELVFTKLMQLSGLNVEAKIKPVQPLGFEFSEAIMAANMTKDEIREKMGMAALDPKVRDQAQIISENINSLSPIVANKVLESMTPDEIRSLAGLGARGLDAIPGQAAPGQEANSVLTSLSGRQLQNIQRIVRKYNKQELTKEQATALLKSGYNFTDDDIKAWLGEDDDPTTPDGMQFRCACSAHDSDDDRMVEEFSACGEDRSQFEVVDSIPVREEFADDLSTLQSDILDLVSKDKRITPEVIADTLKADIRDVSRVMNLLVRKGLMKTTQTQIGSDTIIERELTKPMSEIRKVGNVTTTEILIRYSYEGPEDDRNRPFCAKMLDISKRKMWTRSDIEQISERLGYSVWDRRGGWYTEPDGQRRPFCRHEWKSNIVLRKTTK
jgi:DNA-binding Lrp family transcriptional regulator